jgi:hypothetical protein
MRYGDAPGDQAISHCLPGFLLGAEMMVRSRAPRTQRAAPSSRATDLSQAQAAKSFVVHVLTLGH